MAVRIAVAMLPSSRRETAGDNIRGVSKMALSSLPAGG
jgi:hypothetical protein